MSSMAIVVDILGIECQALEPYGVSNVPKDS